MIIENLLLLNYHYVQIGAFMKRLSKICMADGQSPKWVKPCLVGDQWQVRFSFPIDKSGRIITA